MKTIAFILSMPNVGSWDGKWSAAKDVHCIIKTLKNQDVDKLFDKMPRQERNFYYNFGIARVYFYNYIIQYIKGAAKSKNL